MKVKTSFVPRPSCETQLCVLYEGSGEQDTCVLWLHTREQFDDCLKESYFETCILESTVYTKEKGNLVHV